MTNTQNPLVELRNIEIAFGGIKAVDDVSVDLYPGEVVGLLGHNGAGKSTLIKCLSGAYKKDAGEVLINGKSVEINNPRDARSYNIETIYQTLALADNLDAASNLFLGREIVTKSGMLDEAKMEAETRKIMARLNPNFRKFNEPVSALSGGQRQSVAIARAVYFNAKILIMDEPTAALGPHETQMVAELIQELKKQGLGIFLIDHDVHAVKQLCDRAAVMKNGQLVGVVKVDEVTEDDLLAMIILGRKPEHLAA
ncbi:MULTISPECIES: ATP-binding cassette domain-containing protein [unclassified Marivivens]|jgi:D-xylose transport system ATP-binding protein|uniref:ATP-binding cassette domain-containing protein n=1 Tax=unclassified Marivivens TaxID=2622455 RepID=UPI000801C2DC|nr:MULTISPECIES: ATP-binding cassette domain-containing protein [unclassified Marivivens]MCL7406345.1 ATP-binding cassette domain-containing protein [Marivivens geojensis]OBR39909.1 ABC transporter ATP-binding protein [Donghicola sp. JL3646]APO87187.1 ABC transporter ATP-binding protein [Marivivens sp. JLT3646]NBQ49353.1 sugar ABC transporter ATP-binding protein [Marivivens sp.]NBT51488.1 sugar ABC transporter ATP-binding protein [Marivivens sp.]